MPESADSFGDGSVVAIGPCWFCKKPFPFDPDEVPSISIDPQTGHPPDIPPQAEGGYERAQTEPICDPCARRGNQVRREAGLPMAWPELGLPS